MYKFSGLYYLVLKSNSLITGIWTDFYVEGQLSTTLHKKVYVTYTVFNLYSQTFSVVNRSFDVEFNINLAVLLHFSHNILLEKSCHELLISKSQRVWNNQIHVGISFHCYKWKHIKHNNNENEQQYIIVKS